MKQQLNLRVSDLTTHQLKQLMERWGTSKTETLTVIIDRAYTEEARKDGTPTAIGCAVSTVTRAYEAADKK